MKHIKLFLTILLVLFITTSTASAAYSFHNSGKYQPSHSHYFPHSDSQRPCNNCVSCSGNNCDTCTNGNCGCTGGNCNTCSGGNCNTGSRDTNIPPNTCPGGNCNTGSGDTNTPPVTPTDATGTTTYKLCSKNVCNVGGNGQVLTLTNYNNATNPSYDQLLKFLKADRTDERSYTSQYVCSDFARTLTIMQKRQV